MQTCILCSFKKEYYFPSKYNLFLPLLLWLWQCSKRLLFITLLSFICKVSCFRINFEQTLSNKVFKSDFTSDWLQSSSIFDAKFLKMNGKTDRLDSHSNRGLATFWVDVFFFFIFYPYTWKGYVLRNRSLCVPMPIIK